MASIFLYGSKTDAMITDAVLLGRERGDSYSVVYDKRSTRLLGIHCAFTDGSFCHEKQEDDV